MSVSAGKRAEKERTGGKGRKGERSEKKAGRQTRCQREEDEPYLYLCHVAISLASLKCD